MGGVITVTTRNVSASPAATQEGSAARHQRAELRRLRLLSASQLRRTSDLSPQERVSLPAKLAQWTPSRLAASPPLPPSLQEKEATAAEKPELVKEKEPKRRASRAERVRRSLSCRPTLRLRRRGPVGAPLPETAQCAGKPPPPRT